MFLIARQMSGLSAVVGACLCTLVSACGPAHPAYFQHQANAFDRSFVATTPDVKAPGDSLPARTVSSAEEPASVAINTAAETLPIAADRVADGTPPSTGRKVLHRNPDSQSKRQIRRLLDVLPIDHVPLRSEQIDRQSSTRKTHRLGLVALGLSVLGYAPLLIAGGGTLAWTLGLVLPLAAVLLGAASLTAIHRNKDRLRGRGWAMAAIVIGTGAMGLALLAVAALSVSKVVWER